MGMNDVKERIEFTKKQVELSKFILKSEHRKAVLETLHQSRKYFNQLCKELGGSKSTVAGALDDLVDKGIVDFKWEVIEKKAAMRNPARFSAVKMFFIKPEYCDLVEKLNL
jgi:DNA-binding transcriptional ArsR family regulator